MLSVIGCGNPNRSDDGAGIQVIRSLQYRLGSKTPPEVRLLDAGTNGMEVLFRARGSHALILVDACQTGSPPGAVFRVPGEELASPPPQSFNLHDFRWDHALFAGRKIYAEDFPQQVTVYLIEAATLALGTHLTSPVQQAVEQVTQQILDDIHEWQHHTA